MSVKATRTLPHPQPRPISDWEEAEENALEWIRWLGFIGAKRTSGGADRGLDIEGKEVFGQVKFHGKAIAPNFIQQLFGARGHREGEMFFFSNSGYTEAALECADELGVSCFRYSPTDGRISSCNVYAKKVLQAAQTTRAVREGRALRTLDESIFIAGSYAEFSPGGSMVAYKNSPTSARVEDFPSRANIASFDTDSIILGLDFIGPELLAIHLPLVNETRIVDARSNTIVRTIGERSQIKTDMTYMRQVECGGKVLLERTSDSQLNVWSTLTGDLEEFSGLPRTTSASSTLVSWSMSPKRTLVTCACRESGKSRSRYLRIADHPHLICPGDRDGVLHHFAFTSDGSLMAAVGETPQIDLWDMDKADRIGVLRTGSPLLEEEEDSLTAVKFSTDNSLLAVGGYDKTVRLWSVPLREEIAVLKGCGGNIEKISFSPDGRYLLASDDDETARLWDISSLTYESY
ncbi:hypothetical protein SUDANB15_07321 [Streptomyces sp. enrichment culture]|uniref:restriction endonuclease n=1 Tax=Streptomyces sp. enrichment culture TaxID=1795815 RepID=UPI003F547A6C